MTVERIDGEPSQAWHCHPLDPPSDPEDISRPPPVLGYAGRRDNLGGLSLDFQNSLDVAEGGEYQDDEDQNSLERQL